MPRQSLGRRLARGFIRLYQLTLSAFVGRSCRYLPTCSEYTDLAITRFGVWPGMWMGIARISRCRPGGGHGFDPCPESLPAGAVWWRPWRFGVWRFEDG